jgi:serine/threonine protein kinase
MATNNNKPPSAHTAKFDFKVSADDVEQAITGQHPAVGDAPQASGPNPAKPPAPPSMGALGAGIGAKTGAAKLGDDKGGKTGSLQTAKFNFKASMDDFEKVISGEMPAPQSAPGGGTAPIATAGGGSAGGSVETGAHWGKPAAPAAPPAPPPPQPQAPPDRTVAINSALVGGPDRTIPISGGGGGMGSAPDRTMPIEFTPEQMAAIEARVAAGARGGASPALNTPIMGNPAMGGPSMGGPSIGAPPQGPGPAFPNAATPAIFPGAAGAPGAFPNASSSGQAPRPQFPEADSKLGPIPDVGRPQLHHAPNIEGYVLTDELASGEDWAVFKGVQLKPRRDVVVKPLIYEGPPEHRQAFFDRHQRDTLLLEEHPHPKIAKVYDVARDVYGKKWIIMEYVEGISLDRKLQQGDTFRVEGAVRVARSLCEALHHAHEIGVVHRDLRPACVMLTPARDAKVLDFGLAGSHGDSVAASRAAIHAPYYLPPELLYGNGLGGDRRSDIYSIAVVLYHLLCGRPPFQDPNPFQLAEQIRDLPPMRPSSLRSEIPPELDAIVLKALAKSARDRYHNAADMGQALDRLLIALDAGDGMTLTSRGSSLLPGSGQPIDPIKLGILVGAPALLLIVSLGFFIFGGSPPPAPPPQMGAGGVASGGPSVEEAERLFISGQYPQAREVVLRLNQGIPDVAELKVAIEAYIEAEDLLTRNQIREAKAVLGRVKGVREGLGPIIELRRRVDERVGALGREAFSRGKSELEAGRYDSARQQFSEALQYDPQNREADLLREVARLAKLMVETEDQTAKLLERSQYAEAADAADVALKAAARSLVTGAADKVKDKSAHLTDLQAYALMMKAYERDADYIEALKHYDRISPEFRKDRRLNILRDRIEKVGKDATVALDQRSIEYAKRVLAQESTPGNKYREKMQELLKELELTGTSGSSELIAEARGLSRNNDSDGLIAALKLLAQARRDNSRDEEAKKEHRDVADRIILKANSLGFTPQEEAQKKRLLEAVRDFSLEDDKVYQHAVDKLRNMR